MYYRPDQLPADLKTLLRGLSRGKTLEGHATLGLEGYLFPVLRLLVGALVLGFSLYTVARGSWELRSDEATLHAVLGAVGGALVLNALFRVLRLLFSGIKPAMVVNRLCVAATRGGSSPVLVARLADLKWKHGGVTSHKITLELPDGSHVYRSPLFSDGFGFATRLSGRNAAEGTPEEDWVARLEEAGVEGAPRGPGWAGRFLRAALVMVAGAVLGYGVALHARVIRYQNVEARYWRDCESGRDAEYTCGKYVRWAEPFQTNLLDKRYDDIEGMYREYEAWKKSTASMRLGPPRDRMRRYEGVYRMKQRGDSPRGEPYLRHTPLAEHAPLALERYDDASFEKIRDSRLAESFREYLRDWPKGRNRDAARERLRGLYRVATERYQKMVAGRPTTPEAVQGMLALLEHLRQEDPVTPKVPICFLPVSGLEGGKIEELVAALTGSEKVHPVEPAFTAAANKRRNGLVVGYIDRALKRVVGDLFVPEWWAPEAVRDRPRFLVHYEVKATGRAYGVTSEESLPPAERNQYVGIAIEFDFTIQVPEDGGSLTDDPEEGHRFGFVARPAPNFSVAGATSPEVFARKVYDRMAETAFDEFTRKLAAAYGMGDGK
jgi:hypothetical protein